MSIGVLIVDDSAVVRETLRVLLDGEPDICVVGTAADPYVAAKRIRSTVPDVVVLDIEMPRMDGLTFLGKLMAQRPLPVVICSSLTEDSAEATMRAFELGAVEVIGKPRINTREFLVESRTRIGDAVRAAAGVRVDRARSRRRLDVEPRLSADAVLPLVPGRTVKAEGERVIVIGASTGGIEALRTVLGSMPPNCPPIVVVQHLPARFVPSFCARVDSLCDISVRPASAGERLAKNTALVASGEEHLVVRRTGSRTYVESQPGPLVCRQRPSVDVLFRSAALECGADTVAALLTGMGDDGASGMVEIRNAGGRTVAEDESTCAVFGMPRAAIERGGAEFVVPLHRISSALLSLAAQPVTTRT